MSFESLLLSGTHFGVPCAHVNQFTRDTYSVRAGHGVPPIWPRERLRIIDEARPTHVVLARTRGTRSWTPPGPLLGKWAETLDERDHELRSALCGIEAVAQGLNCQHERLTTAQLIELTGALAAEARRLRTLLDPRTAEQATFDLADAVRPVVTSFRTMGVDVRMAVPCGIAVEGRRDDTAQAVFTLLDNARKHAAMSAIDVRATVCGGVTTLYVEDDGIGIASGLGERLFDRGVRGDSSAGRGLGLFIARRLMTAQGGSLAVQPRPGGGTSFALGLRSAPSSSHQRLHAIPLLGAVTA